MKILETPEFFIYFGSAHDGLKHGIESSPDAFLNLKRITGAHSLVFVNQIHGIDGVVIGDDYKIISPVMLLSEEADIVLTNRSKIGIGVHTADCLPVVITDTKKHVAAVIHAGWRGGVKSIVTHALSMLKERFKSSLKDLTFYFGPCAKICCYEVSKDFIHQVPPQYQESCLIHRNGKYFFDIPELNRLQLIDARIDREKIMLDYNACTMCSNDLCSYRRNGRKAGGQATIVVIK